LTALTPRKGTPDLKLTEEEFRRRFLNQFTDPAFEPLATELDRVAKAAWDGYANSRKSPRTQKAGEEFADPAYDLAIDWYKTYRAIKVAEQTYSDPTSPSHVVLVSCSPRNEHTCPGEISKSYRLAQIAEDELQKQSIGVTLLNLSRLTAEYGLHIHPCKACFSTAAALCHWPCSCYPNYSLGQTQDLMNEIYPLLVGAHGIMLVTPVNWYQPSSPLKLMMDRLVCADGGNPDPTTTHGKDAERAKELEMDGWDYPRHLAGRLFSIVAHGDTEGAEGVRRILSDWLGSIGLISAGTFAEFGRYIGYWKPYATSHNELDQDCAVQEEVRNAARTLAEAIKATRSGHQIEAGANCTEPRKK
jgi:multimeric flavodoxin WrbA